MMNSALLSISVALLWSLVVANPGNAAQTERRQDIPNLMAAETNRTAVAPAIQVSNPANPCALAGKGGTRALCGNRGLLDSGTIAPEKSQYLSAVIITTVIIMLIVLAVLAVLSLALILLASWARRLPPRPEESGEANLPDLSLPEDTRPEPVWTYHPTMQER
ncbi:MAG: hypothetical protein HOP22_04640 [Nitrospiraceae bacterium]|nr:hypothetical protein [Nitrospiraceae bacterium]